MANFTQLEKNRQILQSQLDHFKKKEQRNAMGQYSTPIALANDILKHAAIIMPKQEKIRFLDPAFGTGALFSALNSTFPSTQIETAKGYEIDEHYGIPTQKLWFETMIELHLADFTKAVPPIDDKDKYNLIICNPPYVRHHHLNGMKKRLQAEALSAANMKLSGLAGLYCYFIALSHRWLKTDGIAGWLIPSEFMDVNYGQAVQNYLLNEVTLLQIQRFDPKDVQFDDAVVIAGFITKISIA